MSGRSIPTPIAAQATLFLAAACYRRDQGQSCTARSISMNASAEESELVSRRRLRLMAASAFALLSAPAAAQDGWTPRGVALRLGPGRHDVGRNAVRRAGGRRERRRRPVGARLRRHGRARGAQRPLGADRRPALRRPDRARRHPVRRAVLARAHRDRADDGERLRRVPGARGRARCRRPDGRLPRRFRRSRRDADARPAAGPAVRRQRQLGRSAGRRARPRRDDRPVVRDGVRRPRRRRRGHGPDLAGRRDRRLPVQRAMVGAGRLAPALRSRSGSRAATWSSTSAARCSA